MPVSQSLYRSSLWGTESKALAKSRNTISVCRFDIAMIEEVVEEWIYF